MAPLDNTTIWQRHHPVDLPASEPWDGLADAEPTPPGSMVVEVNDDGGVTVRQTAPDKPKPADAGKFDENLAELPELDGALGEIAQEILDGVQTDLESRQPFLDNLTRGMDLLGLVIENQAQTKGQKAKTSRIRDTTLLESVVKAQSQARGELLPAAGPAKIATDAESPQEDVELAGDYESDLNQALVVGMPEYVPDMDRGLFGFFFGGNMFRYGYHCPIKGRPRVDTVDVTDLIVSQEATDLDTATRWTIRIPAMSPMEVKRKQFYGVWRDCDLGSPMPETDAVLQKKEQLSGFIGQMTRPKDLPYTIYQTVQDWDFRPFGYVEEGTEEGQAVPYRFTVEKHSRQVLRIERFWKGGDPTFARKRRCVHYGMVPGFGFLAYGFLHLQGNSVATLTAVVRLLIDNLMFGNFPGGVKIKGQRNETNEIEPAPGEFVELGVPAGMDDIRKVIMALPYKDLSPVAISLYELVQQATARVGAAAMLEVGEGRAQMPVGTIMAMLEEKSVVMAAVHKRLHEAMGQELRMIRELYAERPESWQKVLANPRREWAAVQETADLNLVPHSDPNIPSQVHRVMQATALATLATMFPQLLDVVEVMRRVLKMIGVSDTQNIVKPAQPQGDPNAASAQASVAVTQMKIQAQAQENQRKAASEVVKTQQQERDSQRQNAVDMAKIEADLRIAAMKDDTARTNAAVQAAQADREHQGDMAQADADRHASMQQAAQRSFAPTGGF